MPEASSGIKVLSASAHALTQAVHASQHGGLWDWSDVTGWVPVGNKIILGGLAKYQMICLNSGGRSENFAIVKTEILLNEDGLL